MTDISVIGPLARSAEDLALALDALYGPDPAETKLTLPAAAAARQAAGGPARRRLAEPAGPVTDAETTGLLEDLAKFLRGSGAKVSRTARPAFDRDRGVSTSI